MVDVKFTSHWCTPVTDGKSVTSKSCKSDGVFRENLHIMTEHRLNLLSY